MWLPTVSCGDIQKQGAVLKVSWETTRKRKKDKMSYNTIIVDFKF